MNGLAHRASHAAWWSALEITSRYGVQFVVMIVLARLLTPADFGLIAMLLVFINIGTILAEAGFGTALVQRQDVTGDDATTVFWFSNATGLAAAIVLWLCADPIAWLYDQPRLIDLTHALAWVLPLAAWGAVPDALLTRRLDFRARTGAQAIASVASGALAIATALHGLGVWSLVAQALAAAGLRSAFVWMLSGWRPCGRFRLASFRSMFGFGGFMLLSGLLNTLSTRVQALVIGYRFDAATLGYYTLAQNASGAPTNLIGAVLGRVGLPVFSALADDKARLREALQRSLRVAMFVFVPCMVGLAIAAHPVIDMVYGPRWLAASPMLTLLALAGAVWPLHVLNLSALTAQGRSDRFFRLDLIKNLTVVVMTFVAARWGAVAVAAAALVSSLCGVGINTWYTRKMLGYGLAAQMRDQLPTLLTAAVAALPAWAILHWNAPGVLVTITATASALIVYAVLAVFARNPGWLELRLIARNLLAHNHDTGDTTA